jgi:hypothetical protein
LSSPGLRFGRLFGGRARAIWEEERHHWLMDRWRGFSGQRSTGSITG